MASGFLSERVLWGVAGDGPDRHKNVERNIHNFTQTYEDYQTGYISVRLSALRAMIAAARITSTRLYGVSIACRS